MIIIKNKLTTSNIGKNHTEYSLYYNNKRIFHCFFVQGMGYITNDYS